MVWSGKCIGEGHTMNNKIRFAILGAGVVAGFHADAVESIENAELVGVYDPNTDNASKFAEKYNITSYESYENLLEETRVDVVCICTPSSFHADNAIMALRHKKHVVVEKPMAICSEDADRIIEEEKKSGCTLTVISQLRFSDDIKTVKKLVEEGAFGKISFCDLYMKYWRDTDYYKTSSWKGTKAIDGGGAVMNQGIHGIDLILYIMGNAKVVGSKTKTILHDIEVEDTATALLEFDNGALGVIEASTGVYPGFERRIEIMGSTGYVILKENVIEKLVLNKETVIDRKDIELTKSASRPDSLDYEYHARQLRNLIDAISGKDKLLIDCREGKKALQLIEDIYKG